MARVIQVSKENESQQCELWAMTFTKATTSTSSMSPLAAAEAVTLRNDYFNSVHVSMVNNEPKHAAC